METKIKIDNLFAEDEATSTCVPYEEIERKFDIETLEEITTPIGRNAAFYGVFENSIAKYNGTTIELNGEETLVAEQIGEVVPFVNVLKWSGNSWVSVKNYSNPQYCLDNGLLSPGTIIKCVPCDTPEEKFNTEVVYYIPGTGMCDVEGIYVVGVSLEDVGDSLRDEVEATFIGDPEDVENKSNDTEDDDEEEEYGNELNIIPVYPILAYLEEYGVCFNTAKHIIEEFTTK